MLCLAGRSCWDGAFTTLGLVLKSKNAYPYATSVHRGMSAKWGPALEAANASQIATFVTCTVMLCLASVSPGSLFDPKWPRPSKELAPFAAMASWWLWGIVSSSMLIRFCSLPYAHSDSRYKPFQHHHTSWWFVPAVGVLRHHSAYFSIHWYDAIARDEFTAMGLGFIWQSNSPWASSLHLVLKQVVPLCSPGFPALHYGCWSAPEQQHALLYMQVPPGL